MNAGERISDYVVERVLGEGGMGTVYLARHTVLDQQVAIKILDPEVARKPGVKERFIREANIQAKLKHPHIVQVLTATNAEGGVPALIMEYVDGRSLSEVLEIRGALPIDDAIKVMVQVLSAVGYAHKQGVIHRDLKPSNVMVMGSGEAKVTDFGIAKVLGSSKLTRTGTAMGSAHYMSPEQIRRPETVDARSDIYSLGCVFYEVLTGRPPFWEKDASGTESDFEVKNAHVYETARSIGALKSGVPYEMAQLIMAMLEKEPEKRPSSCEVILEKLKAGDNLERAQENKINMASSREQIEQEHKQDQKNSPKDETTGSTAKSVDKAFNQGILIIVVLIVFVVSIFLVQRDKTSSEQHDPAPIETPTASAEQASNTITEQATFLTWKIEAGNPNNLALCPKNRNARFHNCWGTYTSADGYKYIGEFNDDNQHGYGVATWADGDKYVGEFKQGSLSGQGAYYFGASNQFRGEKYVGEFKDNQFNGRGIRYRANGSVKESGVFEANRLVKPE